MGINEGFIEEIKNCVSTGDIDGALQIILKNNAQYAENVEFLKAKACLCMRVDEFDTAIKILKQAEKISVDDGEIYYYLSKCYEKRYFDKDNNIIIVDTNQVKPMQYEDTLNLYKNRDVADLRLAEENDPLISILFLAYNNLEKYTKKSIKCLLKYTQGIDYELILIDNGSEDGTFEYFKSLNVPRKRIYRITKNLGAGFASLGAENNTKGRFYKGKYVVCLPNDVFVTENWLKNMLICMESDPSIAMAVPMSDNVSNWQSVDLRVNNFEEMQLKAKMFNVSDPLKWEERMRVIPTTFITRKSSMSIVRGDTAFVHNFLDDDVAFQYRRNGYKVMVCGDVFVHHEGSTVIANNKDNYRDDLEKGAAIFRKKYYGIDAWDDILNMEIEMVQYLLTDIIIKKKNKVLGIDTRCGSPLLEIKNNLRKKNLTQTELFAYTQDAKYWVDLKTICNGEVFFGDIDRMQKKIINQKFDYILLGKAINNYDNWEDLIGELRNILNLNGRIVFKLDPEISCFENITIDRLLTMKRAKSKNQYRLEEFLSKNKKQVLKEIYYNEKVDYIENRRIEQQLITMGVICKNIEIIKENILFLKRKCIVVLRR